MDFVLVVLELVFSLDFAWVKKLLANQCIQWLLFWTVDFGRVVSLLVWTNQLCVVSLDFACVQIKRGQTDKQTNKQTNKQTDNGFYISGN